MRYQWRLCFPDVDDFRKHILDEAHESHYSIHTGLTKMYHDLREVYWWDGLKKDIPEFVDQCPNCQHLKADHLKPGGILQEIQLPTLKGEDIKMDFVVGFPKTQMQYELIWVVVDRLTMFSHIIPVKSTYSAEDYAKIFIDETVCRHGIPLSIISDRGAQLKSRFWRSFQERLGTKVKLSTIFHPQIDGQAERTIQTLENKLSSSIID